MNMYNKKKFIISMFISAIAILGVSCTDEQKALSDLSDEVDYKYPNGNSLTTDFNKIDVEKNIYHDEVSEYAKQITEIYCNYFLGVEEGTVASDAALETGQQTIVVDNNLDAFNEMDRIPIEELPYSIKEKHINLMDVLRSKINEGQSHDVWVNTVQERYEVGMGARGSMVNDEFFEELTSQFKFRLAYNELIFQYVESIFDEIERYDTDESKLLKNDLISVSCSEQEKIIKDWQQF